MKERIPIKEISENKVGQGVHLYGFTESIRKLGSLIFLHIRDGSGKVQVFYDKNTVSQDIFEIADGIKDENIVHITGIVQKRPEDQIKNISQGAYEIKGENIEIYVQGRTPPFEIDIVEEIKESIKGKYRYLELRNEKIKEKITFGCTITRYIREYFYMQDYLEIETPYLIKSTPEGARDFIVPSRNFKGKFYALTQSPQILKQLLMGSGFDRYFQIARCFRDEDLRSDRQPEFSQLDMERSFITKEEIFEEIENMFAYICEKIGIEIRTPFKKIKYEDAMRSYASDKPDLRNPLVIEDFTEKFKDIKVDFIQKLLSSDNKVLGIKIPHISKSEIKKIEGTMKEKGAAGLLYISREETGMDFTLSKFVDENFYGRFDLDTNTTVIFQILGDKNIHLMSFLRDHLAAFLGLGEEGVRFCWITDFPLFLKDENGQLQSSHHPFTSPVNSSDLINSSELTDIISNAYDIVLNGSELGSGSIRINDVKTQKRVFEILGINEKEQNERFGFLLEAMEYGLPPHGGIALGTARISQMLYGDDSIKDFIAFPKTTSGTCLLTNAPSIISEDQLKELGLKIKEE